MHRTCDHRVSAVVAERFGRAKHGDQLDARIHPFALEEAQLICCQSREASVANKVDGCDTKLHEYLGKRI
jgi:hypothetical protein